MQQEAAPGLALEAPVAKILFKHWLAMPLTKFKRLEEVKDYKNILAQQQRQLLESPKLLDTRKQVDLAPRPPSRQAHRSSPLPRMMTSHPWQERLSKILTVAVTMAVVVTLNNSTTSTTRTMEMILVLSPSGL